MKMLVVNNPPGGTIPPTPLEMGEMPGYFILLPMTEKKGEFGK